MNQTSLDKIDVLLHQQASTAQQYPHMARNWVGATLGIAQDWQCWCCSLAMGSLLIASSPEYVSAQITPDGTLPNNSIVTPDGNTLNITGGTQAGSNLFHSFSEFSVSPGGIASFNNALDIQNIISRVTGGSHSNIDGIISTKGTANLFLINPNGIIFGQNASLNIGGSFLASTASVVKFADSFELNATSPQTTPLLTISVPIGLQFEGTAGGIRVEGSYLKMQPGTTLALVGGDVTLHGSERTAFGQSNLKVPGGRVELGGIAGTGTVGVNVDSNNVFLSSSNNPAATEISAPELFLSYPDNVAKANIFAYQSSVEGNSIQLQGKQITLTGGSGILATDFSYLNLLTGNPITYVRSPQGGNVRINAEILSVRDGSAVTASLTNQFSVPGAKLTVNASDSVEVSGTSNIRVASFANTSEELTLSTKRLILQDGGKVTAFAARNSPQGGGNLTINASDSVEITGLSKERFSGFILFNDFSEDGRSISGIFSTVFNVGDAGNININTKRLLIQDGARISASSFSIGKSGNININASDSVKLNGTSADGLVRSGLFATATFSSGGNITIKTEYLNVQNRAQVTVANQPFFEMSSINSNSAGNIDIQADNIYLNNQAVLDANSFSGEAGNISLQADMLLLRRNSNISATSGIPRFFTYNSIVRTDQDGNVIVVGTETLDFSSPGQDGNINIDTKFLIAVPSENSDIVATGFGRTPGSNVQVNAQGIFGAQFRQQLTNKSDIVATGQITLNTPGIDPDSGLIELPTVPVDTQLAQGCYSPGYAQNRFVITGRGGLPFNPKDILTPDASQTDWVPFKPTNNNRSLPPVTSKPTISAPKRIVEATGAVLNAKGQIVLSANSSTATPNTFNQNSTQCYGS
ncbi:filamentous hemagglutinin N-terminal domain-containing protein [Nostoc flagelliforme FACHB-838]|uniref:Filamentous hemagglutinin N-terminal domain-containing protein n=1 Tax=Nostoc flagelliforme FACHB-838 TaxID=2692904 RepID=A0ABR8DX33_9NOSO|nr:filamentous hemagglutinin N-terminal domain-containing protein [Nostoc flagelliforme]MBD2534009.1 filamentous hemagglutinin N-terminal domain-containing protein [Nostoc flagelliforme FACHB-838]